MKNALRIGTVAEIAIYLHWTFGLLLVGFFFYYLWQGSSVAGAFVGLGFVLAVFFCVVLHELGHALTARRYDVPTKDITLYPIGGVARLQRIPDEPRQELWIALAGPAVNVVIALLLAPVVFALGEPLWPEALDRPVGGFLAMLLWVNVVLVLFNLLPAFPMDGGRVLRALLALRMDYAKATKVAAGVGQGMAILFGLFGLLAFNPILLFIALFVYIGAQQEAQQAEMRTVTAGMAVREAMMTRFQTLRPEDTLDAAIEALLAGSEHDFPVVADGAVVGLLTRKTMMQALAEHGRGARVSDVVPVGCLTVEESAELDAAFAEMQEAGCTSAPVVRAGQIVGLLTFENVGELLMISSALRKAR